MKRCKTHFAGLSPLDDAKTAFCLALVTRQWFSWHLAGLYYGSLGFLKTHCQHIPIALTVVDSQVIHWIEEFPLHLSMKAIHTYLNHAKPELLTNPANTLSLEKLASTSTHSSIYRCWLLTETTRHELCQPWQQQGLTIGALEPLSYLEKRVCKPYHDDRQLLTTIPTPYHHTAKLALKLACRADWLRGVP